MAYLISSRDLTLNNRKAFRHQVHEQLLVTAANSRIATPDNLIVRQLAPRDLGLASWSTPTLAPGIFTPWINNFTITQPVVIGLMRIIQLSGDPHVCSIKIGRGIYGAIINAAFELEPMYAGLPTIKSLASLLADKEMREVLNKMVGRESTGDRVNSDFGAPLEAYFSEPVIYKQFDTPFASVTTREKTEPDYLVLDGLVAELKGVTIS